MIAIVMGSASDYEIMAESTQVLDEFGVSYEVMVTSAHRSPARTLQFVRSIERKGIRAVIVGAGGAAHLAGVVAAHTVVPVIGVPIDSSSLKGLDSLLSTVQMPSGVPVATVAIGKAGAVNAAILAVEILALRDKALARKLREYRKRLAKKVERSNNTLKEARKRPEIRKES